MRDSCFSGPSERPRKSTDGKEAGLLILVSPKIISFPKFFIFFYFRAHKNINKIYNHLLNRTRKKQSTFNNNHKRLISGENPMNGMRRERFITASCFAFEMKDYPVDSSPYETAPSPKFSSFK